MRRVIDMIINEYEYLEYALLSTAFHWQALNIIDVSVLIPPPTSPFFSSTFVISLTYSAACASDPSPIESSKNSDNGIGPMLRTAKLLSGEIGVVELTSLDLDEIDDCLAYRTYMVGHSPTLPNWAVWVP